jgi:hypothetical protein
MWSLFWVSIRRLAHLQMKLTLQHGILLCAQLFYAMIVADTGCFVHFGWSQDNQVHSSVVFEGGIGAQKPLRGTHLVASVMFARVGDGERWSNSSIRLSETSVAHGHKGAKADVRNVGLPCDIIFATM